MALGRPQERYRRWFLGEYGTLRNIYLNRVETLDLADTYIALSVQAEGEVSGSQVPATTLMGPSGPHRILIVGDPGTGKSTLLRAYGSGVLRPGVGESELNLFGGTSELPVLVTLRQVADSLVRGGRLEDHVLGVLGRRSGARNARAMLRRLLLQGRIVVLLDGLDEVARPAYDAVRSAIYSFVHTAEDAELPTGLARVVISCRRQNYRQIEEDWSWFATTSYAMVALNDADIDRFVQRRATQFTDERSGAAFLADVHASGTIELHRVPLILTISLGLYTQLAAYEIPHSIGNFYDEMVRELLRRHDFRAEGQLRMNRYKTEDKHRFLRELALHLAQTRTSPFADFTYGDLLAFCAAQRRRMPRVDDERRFVDEIIDRSGLLMRTTEEDQFAFAHRALHEHLAAAQLAKDPQEGCKFLHDRADDPQWRQVAVLFCGESHPHVETFLRGLAGLSPDLACQCLATAEVSADVAVDMIETARTRRMLPAIMEAAKSPVPETRTRALLALQAELTDLATSPGRQRRDRLVADLFSGHLPAAGKLLLSMAEQRTPAMAAAVTQLASALPPDEQTLVAPLWRCLAIPGIDRHRDLARELIGRLLVLAMDPECAATLERLPPLRPDWLIPEDLEAAYPLRRGLSPDSNLVVLLGMGQALRMLDQVPRKNLYLTALTEPGRPLALIEASPFWSKVSLHRIAKTLSYSAFYATITVSLGVTILSMTGRISIDLEPALAGLGASLCAFTIIVLGLSTYAARRYFDYIYGGRFTKWSYLLPSVNPTFGLPRIEQLWGLMAERPQIAATYRLRNWTLESVPVLLVHLSTTAIYGLPAAALLPQPWLVPFVVIPVLLLFYWLPATELCGEHTTRLFLSSRRFLGIYQDPESRHWVLPRTSTPPSQRRRAGPPSRSLTGSKN
ncbi:hypothetical protein I0C86_12070 [Plantactinospora sp. S1510]|uniref:NACHT domain-containing protein n=1 Tax=Plantactinospora alkalitolerans TaxID=2789879 RepID=A0ABS0GU22_9ACTN|nr:hypothetical protein [Plantactinospora alkalitolerans]MBF9129690.1 hypothetical protein [Plantactinospora alkalitolerans]